MRIQALYNRDGVIVAAAQIGGDYDGPVPKAAEGAEMAQLDVPDTLAETSLDEICRTMRVDPARRVLVARDEIG